MTFTFPKAEKLCRKAEIEAVFKFGKSQQEFPLKLIFLENTSSSMPLKAGFSVPKKTFKRAVDRNLLKRRMREGYRLHKQPLIDSLRNKGLALDVFFIYLSREKLDYALIEHKIMLLLQRLENKYEESP